MSKKKRKQIIKDKIKELEQDIALRNDVVSGLQVKVDALKNLLEQFKDSTDKEFNEIYDIIKNS